MIESKYFSAFFVLLIIYSCDAQKETNTTLNPITHKYLVNFKDSNYSSSTEQYFTVFNSSLSPVAVVQIQLVQGSCLGVVTPSNETVILRCPEKQLEESCYLQYVPKNSEKVDKICVKPLGSNYSGITTSSGWILLYDFIPDSSNKAKVPHHPPKPHYKATLRFIGKVPSLRPSRYRRGLQ